MLDGSESVSNDTDKFCYQSVCLFRYSDGELLLTYKDGDPCHTHFRRNTIINFICDQNAGEMDSNIRPVSRWDVSALSAGDMDCCIYPVSRWGGFLYQSSQQVIIIHPVSRWDGFLYQSCQQVRCICPVSRWDGFLYLSCQQVRWISCISPASRWDGFLYLSYQQVRWIPVSVLSAGEMDSCISPVSRWDVSVLSAGEIDSWTSPVSRWGGFQYLSCQQVRWIPVFVLSAGEVDSCICPVSRWGVIVLSAEKAENDHLTPVELVLVSLVSGSQFWGWILTAGTCAKSLI